LSGPLERVKRLIARSAEPLRAINEEELRYQKCMQEWNDHYLEDDWCDSSAAEQCKSFIEWFEESRQ